MVCLVGWNDKGGEKIGERRVFGWGWVNGCGETLLPNLGRKIERKVGREWVWWETTHLPSPYLMLLFFFPSSFLFLAGVELDFVSCFAFCFFFFWALFHVLLLLLLLFFSFLFLFIFIFYLFSYQTETFIIIIIIIIVIFPYVLLVLLVCSN